MSTVASPDRSGHPGSVGTPAAPTGMDLDAIDERALLEIAREAIWRTWRSQKAAAIDLGVDQRDLSKWLSGSYRDRFPLALLARHEAFRGEFLVLAAQRSGLLVRRRADKAERLARIRTRMLALVGELDELEVA